MSAAGAARLRPDYREVVVLFYIEGASYQEICEATGLPLGTVKTNLHRARKELADELKRLVEGMKATQRPETALHRRVYRPWGYFESIDAGKRFQVKRLMIKPGAKISLQRHQKRAEHWVVVSGKARITREEDTINLIENQSTFIPLGAKHRLENPGSEPLYVIEVQSGSYLGEDDIERFADDYKRD